MKSYPFIDPKALHVGISKLRDMDAAWLRNFSTCDEIVVLQAGEEPVGVMVPYALFQRMQAPLIGRATQASKAKRASSPRRSASAKVKHVLTSEVMQEKRS